VTKKTEGFVTGSSVKLGKILENQDPGKTWQDFPRNVQD
jgi:hypothetical protein